jgi:hypothetical protein
MHGRGKPHARAQQQPDVGGLWSFDWLEEMLGGGNRTGYLTKEQECQTMNQLP